MGGPRSTAVINTAVGKDTHVIENKPDPEVETEAARRLAEALDPSVIDALLADAKTSGTPIDGVDGLLKSDDQSRPRTCPTGRDDPPLGL
jgi:hypothetical protein